ncbi:NepR family anti-sigma factor [Roseococcus sp. YIM B11640]|uniref:NepR family anti-sigma factor n=1 Tax=Roseococcus sp. YIM B11640 TaxID=3133973 RepID=UPI003C7EA315
MADSPDGSAKGAVTALRPKNAGRSRKAPSDVAFDAWLDRGLHAMFDNVAQEPIPQELLNLIERDRNRR